MQISDSEFVLSEPHLAASALVGQIESVALVGAPLSGKTFRLRQIVATLEREGLSPDEILVLTPTRAQAAVLRDLIALDSNQPSSKARARSVTGFAFSLLDDQGWGLLSGAAQEQLLRRLVDGKRSAWKDWGFDPAVIKLNGFVQELRDLFSVIIENELGATQLKQLAQSFPKLRLGSAIDLLPEYLAVLQDEKLVDAAQLALLAAQNISERPMALVVDDAHNFSLGQLKLVESLLVGGKTFIAGDPDVAVLGFRNSSAGAFLDLVRRHGIAEQSLDPGEIQPGPVISLMTKLSSRIPAALSTRHRPQHHPAAFDGAFLYESQSLESDQLAAQLRRLRLREGIDWDQMAVVARTRNQLEQLAADFAARGVPCRIQGAQLALRDQPMSRALLEFMQLALRTDAELDVEQFLTSPLVGLSSIEFRSLLRELRQASGESPRVALRKLLAGSADFAAPSRLTEVISRLEQCRELDQLTAHQAVSIVFELSSKRLAELARGSGPTALAANRALDSALEVFAAARRWDDKALGSALEFARMQLQTAIPEDSLAPIGLRPAVQLLTPASLTQSYPVVAMPRLQEGIWPNLNPRNSLLSAASIQDYLLGRSQDPAQPTRSELADELRFFYRAVSSATQHLILSAMQDEQEQPSQFFQIMGIKPQLVTEPVQFDLRQLVGRLRRQALAGNRDAASKLAAFAVAGIAGANPATWQGMTRPSAEPLSGVNSLAASKLEEFERCPLHWFIQNFGGDASGFSASLGTLMHAALEVSATGVVPSAYVNENWHTLEFESQWQEQRALRQAAQMTVLISEYLATTGELIASEEPFKIQIADMEVRGKIDRIERGSSGIEVVDLKTGKRAPSPDVVASNRQLAIYQLAIEHKYGASAGAKIVSVGSGKLREVSQQPISQQMRDEIQELVQNVARGLESGIFTASMDEHCSGDQSCTLLLTAGVTGG